MAQPQPLTAAEMADVMTNTLGFTEREIWRDVEIMHEGWHDAAVSAFRLRFPSGQEFRVQVEVCGPTTQLPHTR